MRFFTSDTHFMHKNIIKFCNRPYPDERTMTEHMVRIWNETVAWDDDVFHLGDVALGPWEKWDGILTRLNGRKFLSIGNHDRVFAGEKERQRERFGEHYAKWFDAGMSDHITGFPINMGNGVNRLVNLSHFPYDGDSHGEDRYDEFRLEDKGLPLVHGHTHLKDKATVSKNGTPQFHVGWDAWGAPVPESEIVEWLRSL
jgi:calcineurin-like phosphoesterase family protein